MYPNGSLKVFSPEISGLFLGLPGFPGSFPGLRLQGWGVCHIDKKAKRGVDGD